MRFLPLHDPIETLNRHFHDKQQKTEWLKEPACDKQDKNLPVSESLPGNDQTNLMQKMYKNISDALQLIQTHNSDPTFTHTQPKPVRL